VYREQAISRVDHSRRALCWLYAVTADANSRMISAATALNLPVARRLHDLATSQSSRPCSSSEERRHGAASGDFATLTRVGETAHGTNAGRHAARGRARAQKRLPAELRQQLLDAIYSSRPFRTVLRDLGLTSNQVWGLTRTDHEWSERLEATLTANPPGRPGARHERRICAGLRVQ
jgi:hypothetical protein